MNRAFSTYGPTGMALLLAWGGVAEAQALGIRVRREQQLAPSESPAERVMDVWVTPFVTTLLRFDAEVERAELKQEGRERLVDMAVMNQFMVLEPRRWLAPGERPVVEVRFKKGTVPARMMLRLVLSQVEVDTRLDVELRPRANQSPLAAWGEGLEQMEDNLARFVLSGVVGRDANGLGVASDVRSVGSGVRAGEVSNYRILRRRILAFQVENPKGEKAWAAPEVVDLSSTDTRPTGSGGWVAHVEAPIEPGGSGWVVLVGPRQESSAAPMLEVRERGGGRGVWLGAH
jgi:uncharacterized protein (TIGR02268 family)